MAVLDSAETSSTQHKFKQLVDAVGTFVIQDLCTKWTVIQFSWKSGEREDILFLQKLLIIFYFCMKIWGIEFSLSNIVHYL